MRRACTEFTAMVMIFAYACAPVLSAENWAELIHQGKHLQDDGRYSEAGACFQKALSQAELLGVDDPRLTASLRIMGDFYVAYLHSPAKAIECLKREQSILRRFGNDFSGLCSGEEMLGRAYAANGQFAEAEKCYLHAIKIRPKGYALSAHDYYLDLHRYLGECYSDWGKYAQAERCFLEALKYCQTQMRAGDRNSEYWIDMDLGDIYTRQHKYAQALNYYSQANAVIQNHRNMSSNGYFLGLSQLRIGQSCKYLNRLAEAQSWFEKAIKTSALSADDWNIEMYSFYPGLAIIFREHKQYDQARNAARRALKLAEQHQQDHRAHITKELHWFLNDIDARAAAGK